MSKFILNAYGINSGGGLSIYKIFQKGSTTPSEVDQNGKLEEVNEDGSANYKSYVVKLL